jgi:hypothetical protein
LGWAGRASIENASETSILGSESKMRGDGMNIEVIGIGVSKEDTDKIKEIII